MLMLGRSYTRQQIRELVGGGDLQSYLPSVKRRIVCGCFDPKINIDAPDSIFSGSGPKIVASGRWLCEQGGPIPVFLKRATNAWEYVGEYRVRGWSEDPQDLALQKQRTGRNDLTRVIYLSRAS